MTTINTHAELIELFNEDTTRDLHLHMERDCGTREVSFYITTNEQEIVAEGVMLTELDEEAEYINEIAWAVLDDGFENFATVTEYDSLVAGTNPGTVRA